MEILFYIGILITFLGIIPIIILNTRMISDKKKYANTPLKLDEIKADYRKKRFYLMLLQLAGVVVAIVGLMC